jgi:hypothetical protein
LQGGRPAEPPHNYHDSNVVRSGIAFSDFRGYEDLKNRNFTNNCFNDSW